MAADADYVHFQDALEPANAWGAMATAQPGGGITGQDVVMQVAVGVLTRDVTLAGERVAARVAAEQAAADRAARERAAARAAAVQAAAQQAALQAALQPAGPAPQQAMVTPPAASSGTAQEIAEQMLAAYGWTGQFACLDSLWERESGWNVYAENPSSGAYGIPQALPGDKMASAGPDWQTDAATQISWGLTYIQDTYGSPCAAWGHEEADGWY